MLIGSIKILLFLVIIQPKLIAESSTGDNGSFLSGLIHLFGWRADPNNLQELFERFKTELMSKKITKPNIDVKGTYYKETQNFYHVSLFFVIRDTIQSFESPTSKEKQFDKKDVKKFLTHEIIKANSVLREMLIVVYYIDHIFVQSAIPGAPASVRSMVKLTAEKIEKDLGMGVVTIYVDDVVANRAQISMDFNYQPCKGSHFIWNVKLKADKEKSDAMRRRWLTINIMSKLWNSDAAVCKDCSAGCYFRLAQNDWSTANAADKNCIMINRNDSYKTGNFSCFTSMPTKTGSEFCGNAVIEGTEQCDCFPDQCDEANCIAGQCKMKDQKATMPSTIAPKATVPIDTGSPPEEMVTSDDEGFPWIWLILGLIVLALLIGAVVARRKGEQEMQPTGPGSLTDAKDADAANIGTGGIGAGVVPSGTLKGRSSALKSKSNVGSSVGSTASSAVSKSGIGSRSAVDSTISGVSGVSRASSASRSAISGMGSSAASSMAPSAVSGMGSSAASSMAPSAVSSMAPSTFSRASGLNSTVSGARSSMASAVSTVADSQISRASGMRSGFPSRSTVGSTAGSRVSSVISKPGGRAPKSRAGTPPSNIVSGMGHGTGSKSTVASSAIGSKAGKSRFSSPSGMASAFSSVAPSGVSTISTVSPSQARSELASALESKGAKSTAQSVVDSKISKQSKAGSTIAGPGSTAAASRSAAGSAISSKAQAVPSGAGAPPVSALSSKASKVTSTVGSNILASRSRALDSKLSKKGK